MKFSHHLIYIKREIKRLEVTKSGVPGKRSSFFKKGTSTDRGKRAIVSEPEYFNVSISEIFCSLRVKMKENTFNVSCNPMIDVKDPHNNMKIKIKRQDNDKSMDDGRIYLRKLIILVNKDRVPMMYYAVDFSKFPKANVWHVVYKIKQDDKCPYVNLRIISKKADFGKQAITV